MVEQVTEKLNNTNLDPENQAPASSKENKVDIKAVQMLH